MSLRATLQTNAIGFMCVLLLQVTDDDATDNPRVSRGQVGSGGNFPHLSKLLNYYYITMTLKLLPLPVCGDGDTKFQKYWQILHIFWPNKVLIVLE